MLGSRAFWQLLGWALLLGQLAFGDSGSRSLEELSLQDPEEPALVSDEPEKSEAEEPEELLPELGEPEDLSPELEEPEQWSPVQEEPKEKKPLSDEELEEMEKEEREWLEHEKERPCGSWVQYLQSIAMGRLNKEGNKYYKQHGNAALNTKKAIGTMASLKLVLMKTNCTTNQMPGYNSRYSLFMYHYFQRPRNCESLKGSEQECTFTFFNDERKRRFETISVLSKECNPMRPLEKRH